MGQTVGLALEIPRNSTALLVTACARKCAKEY